MVIASEVFEERLTCMKLPRILLTPYPMGRPMGYPNHDKTQKQILRTALMMLEESNGMTVKYI